MALTRAFLKGMGLNDEQIGSIIEAHTETVDGLKNQIATLKVDADKLPGVQKQLDELKANNGDDWKAKAEKAESDFAAFKAEVAKKATRSAKETAYRALLKKAGIADKRIDTVIKVTDFDGITLDKDNKISDADKLEGTIKTEWADFIESSHKEGADPAKPPAGSGGNSGNVSPVVAMYKQHYEALNGVQKGNEK